MPESEEESPASIFEELQKDNFLNQKIHSTLSKQNGKRFVKGHLFMTKNVWIDFFEDSAPQQKKRREDKVLLSLSLPSRFDYGVKLA